jgi:hypothetical protein
MIHVLSHSFSFSFFFSSYSLIYFNPTLEFPSWKERILLEGEGEGEGVGVGKGVG